jgi:hypothetical protein
MRSELPIDVVSAESLACPQTSSGGVTDWPEVEPCAGSDRSRSGHTDSAGSAGAYVATRARQEEPEVSRIDEDLGDRSVTEQALAELPLLRTSGF